MIHADRFTYQPRRKTKHAVEIEDSEEKNFENTLVIFTSVESGDDENEVQVAENAVNEIIDVVEKVSPSSIVIYPYAHLSKKLCTPESSIRILNYMKEKLSEKIKTHLSPFGWYKSFEIKCKGHPLSELSRHVTPEKKITREEVIKKIESRFVILFPDGDEIELNKEKPEEIEKMDINESMKKFLLYEEFKVRKLKEPPSIKVMQRLELVDYEEASDPGHFRFYPKGALMFHLLSDWAYRVSRRLKCLEIETPLLYDWSKPDIRGQALSFHERHYIIDTLENKKLVLRFAGDFGLFRMMKDTILSYKHLPFKVYEHSYSFRYEQRGELTGLKRLRGFHMPDIHSFAKDIEEGWKEFGEIFRSYIDHARGIGAEHLVCFRVVDKFYKKYKDELLELIKYDGKEAFIEILSEMKHYWAVKNEIQCIDSVCGALQLGTVQLDVEDAERYGIVYIDENGNKRGCIICHSSIGSIERWMYVVIEDALKKDKPEFPFWLSPIQLRFIPTSQEYVEHCADIVNKIRCRADIDDRDGTVGKKIRDAEREWIPLIVVVGKKEIESGVYPVRHRDGSIKNMNEDELKAHIRKKMGDFPYRELPLPILMSKRPIFRG